jgi:hypothetical protein
MFSTAKSSKKFSLVIPATEKYIPLVRRYIVEVLTAYQFKGSFLYQMEIMIDELCIKISGEMKKHPPMVWLDIKFEIGKDGFSFDILEQKQQFAEFSEKEYKNSEECRIDSPEIGLIERYSDYARLELTNGKITKVKMTRCGKVD